MNRPLFLKATYANQPAPPGYSPWRTDSSGCVWFRKNDSLAIRGVPPEGEETEAEPAKAGWLSKLIRGIPRS
jgi:hypothetical protein